ncbi:MAG: hypothetical protein BGP22_21500 [Variovorax sp. 67-131]|nr:MAG: hypothetical protein ABS94_11440 [Variovorax sp. SCN 67-85]ODV24719.1 MAG: hypothetical protein ABT25_13355 [Variovorax sp. SCN 67-20]OJZ15386.1 MAG: hypothetical protein BGP22_21500 [Variovorax sp. 67-131]
MDQAWAGFLFSGRCDTGILNSIRIARAWSRTGSKYMFRSSLRHHGQTGAMAWAVIELGLYRSLGPGHFGKIFLMF